MKRVLATLALLLSSSLALATHPQPTPSTSSPPAVATASASASPAANSSAAADAASSSTSTANAMGGNSAATSNASGGESSAHSDSGGNTLSTSYRTEKQAPSGFVATTNSTVGCLKARGLFLSAPGAGIGVSGGKIDHDCTLLIAADEELRRGNLQASIQLRCATKLYRDVFAPEDCLALLNTQTETRADVRVIDETKFATHEEVEKAFKASQSK